MPTNPIQYTVRGIPPEVDRALRDKARRRQISLNKLLVEELTEAVGLPEERRFRSLDGIAGTWKPDPEFDRILREQHQIDWSPWPATKS